MGFLPFEDLHVFQLAENLADEIWNIIKEWNHFNRITIGEQLVKAADSVGANIAEGCGRGTPKDNKRFVRIARGSLNETRYWLRRAYSRNLMEKEKTEKLKTLLDELGPCLNAYLKSIGRGI